MYEILNHSYDDDQSFGIWLSNDEPSQGLHFYKLEKEVEGLCGSKIMHFASSS